MIDFSKVARQLEEAPIEMGDDGVRRVAGSARQRIKQKIDSFNKTGERGRRFESRISSLLDSQEGFGEGHKVLSGNGKTDIIDKEGIGYQVKSKMFNDEPMKVQQSSNASSLWSKLKVPFGQRAIGAGMEDSIKDNKLAQSLIMKFGSPHGSLGKIAKNFEGELTPEQMEMLTKPRDENYPFLSMDEMRDNFGEHNQTLLDHLNDNKLDIFNGLIRQMGGRDGDANPIQRFISHYTDEGVSGRVNELDDDENPIDNFSGRLDVHDLSDETVRKAMDKLMWFDNGSRYYMAEEETDIDNDKLLDLYPYDEDGVSWTMHSKDGNRMYDGIKPGAFKAMMSANPEVLERLFPSIMRGRINFDDKTKKHSFVKDKQSEPTPSPETYADGTPKDDIPDATKPDQGQRFGNFMKKAGGVANQVLDVGTDGLQAGLDAIDKGAPIAADLAGKGIKKGVGWLQRRGDDARKLKKQMDDRRNNQL